MPADAPSTPAPESSPSKWRPYHPFAAALALGLGAGGASGAFVVGPAMAKGIVPTGAPAARGGAEESPAGKGDKGAPQQVYTLDNLVLNPAESGGTRFLLLSVAFETPDGALLEAMKARDAELRDAVLVTLGSKTVEQLADMRARDAIKAELQGAALKLFENRKARMRVYFPQFVIQ